MAAAIRYFAFEGQESPVVEFIDGLAARFGAAIYSDVELVAQYELGSPVSIKSIKGHSPMFEIRTGQYRTFFVFDRGEMWVLACCKKDDQKATIATAAQRMELVQAR